jgi:hypothetical protein
VRKSQGSLLTYHNRAVYFVQPIRLGLLAYKQLNMGILYSEVVFFKNKILTVQGMPVSIKRLHR